MTDILERLRATLSERYEIERELGQGGMATVYLARDIRHDREVAIKVLNPELSASIGAGRFEREIKLAARLQHPHILGLYDSGEADKLLFYVMPYVKGESLRDRLEREGQLPIEDAIQIALEVADALGHAHSQGIVHRDIKPENILLSGGHALVADFGIARAATEAGGSKLTQTGMALGTPVYMAPEQAVGDTVGPTTDLYSLGCVLYEMLAGEPPFLAKSAQALMARHAMEAVPSVRIVRNTVPEEVEDAIFASMAKVAADRPQSAAQFAELLGMPLGATASRRSAIRHTASRRVPTGVHRTFEEPPPPPWWKKPWALGGAALVLAAASFGAWKVASGAGGGRAGLDRDSLANRVAVLYFEDLSPDQSLRGVADGLSEALIRTLSAVPNLRIVSRNGVARFRGDSIPKDSVARALSAGTLVVGTVEPESQDRIRVGTRLLDRQGTDIGRRTSFSVPRSELFTAEDSVATEVSRTLREWLGPEIQLRESQAGTRVLAAWTLLNQGESKRKDAEAQARASQPARAATLFAEADSLLRLAQAADPKWIDPVLLQGEAANQRGRLERDRAARGVWVDSAMLAAERALALDPASARALALRGTLRYAQWSLARTTDPVARAALLDGAQRDLDGAVQKDGTLASAYATLSFVYQDQKDVYTALDRARRAYEADAFLANSDVVLDRLFWAYYNTEQFNEAPKWCREGARRFPRDPRFAACALWLLLTPDAEPDIPEAWRLARRVDSLAPAAGRWMQSHLAQVVVGGVIGRAARAAPAGPPRQLLADSAHRVLLRARGDATTDPTQELVGYEAIMLTQMGEYDDAITLLKQYVALNPDHSFRVGTNVHWWWKDLKNHPGFELLISRKR